MRKVLINIVKGACSKYGIKYQGDKISEDKLLSWLEKQGEQNKWKPSKDEMDALYGLAYMTNKMDDKKDEAITKLYQDLKREFFDGASYENMFPSSPVDALIKDEKQGEQKLIIEGTFVNVDEVREDFMQEVYRILNADQTNDRANQIIEVFDNLPTVEFEKQGEQKSILDFKAKDWYVSKVDGKIHNMTYDTALKVEPKFKVGDWIMSNVSHEDYRICKILKIENGEYVIESIYGYKGHNNFETFDKDYHLWTIEDAKDGDVLVADNSLAFIYSECLKEQQWPFAYGGINIYGRFNISDGLLLFNISDGLLPFTHQKVVPATKEQCDLLFKKMKESGYEWNAEKKGLKKIEQKSTAWSEDDDATHTRILGALGKVFMGVFPTKPSREDIEWFKFLPKRFSLRPNQEWGEEDEKMYTETIFALAGFIGNEDKLDWLKSLKYRYTWTPSDVQMEALESATENCAYSEYQDCLRELIGQLKKLRGK